MDILIVGAGACGLMAARELSKKGNKVTILEARNRIGGRIFPLDQKKFKYPAQGGAEFIHGEAKTTRTLMNESGLTYVDNTGGDFLHFENNKFIQGDLDEISENNVLKEKLKVLKTDMTVEAFFEKEFSGNKFAKLRKQVYERVKGYDAADPARMSILSLKYDWLGDDHNWIQGRIKEGYGTLIDYLLDGCKKNGVDILVNQKVKSINFTQNLVVLDCSDGRAFKGERIIVTVPVKLIPNINFTPNIPEAINAVNQIGYGGAIKIVLKFKDVWWLDRDRIDFTKLNFLLARGLGQVWWTQYPKNNPILTCYISGPQTDKFKTTSNEDLLNLAFTSLATILNEEKDELIKDCEHSEVFNWAADPYSMGAYSYPTPKSQGALKILNEPVNNKIFFAGEALASESTATVDGALKSGLEVSEKIINSIPLK